MLENIKEKLSRTRQTFTERFDEIIRSKKTKEEILEKLEESMLLSDPPFFLLVHS